MPPDPIITLTTDFGEGSPYVAILKGVILGLNPSVRLVDLSHQVPPQDVRHAAYYLAQAVPFFPPGVLHLVVVDPGVGSSRALLYVEVSGHRLLVPDNGCWAGLASAASSPPTVYRLTEPRYWRHPVSATFHGRDILAPVAGHLSLGISPRELGVLTSQWVQLQCRPASLGTDRLAGEVEFIDHFGNLLTNIPGEAFVALADRPVRILVGGQEVPRRAPTYSSAEPGSPLALISSSGKLEIAVNQGSAAIRLGAKVGTEVNVMILDSKGN